MSPGKRSGFATLCMWGGTSVQPVLEIDFAPNFAQNSALLRVEYPKRAGRMN
jgi:hypothetical protein